jgi:hypothetical protein
MEKEAFVGPAAFRRSRVPVVGLAAACLYMYVRCVPRRASLVTPGFKGVKNKIRRKLM